MSDAELVLDLPDGRRLGAALRGHPDGAPVVLLHGSPGSRLSRYPFGDDLAEAGVLLVTLDRPGYGVSTPRPSRTVADVVPDVLAVLDHLGVDRAGVVGGSGGGPHALAVGALAPDRCSRVTAVVSLAPFDADGLDWYAGMDPENVRRFRVAEQGLAAAREELGPDLAAIVQRMADDPATMLGPMRLPEADRALMRQNAVHAVAGIRESARQGGEGWAEDFVAFVQPWGFEVADVAVPVALEYGALDVNVPAGHGDWLAAHLPTADVTRSDGGHQAPLDVALRRLIAAAGLKH